MPERNLSPDQFSPGDGYAPDPKVPTKGTTRFVCQTCWSRYVAPVKIDPAITRITNCRNEGCPGPVLRA